MNTKIKDEQPWPGRARARVSPCEMEPLCVVLEQRGGMAGGMRLSETRDNEVGCGKIELCGPQHLSLMRQQAWDLPLVCVVGPVTAALGAPRTNIAQHYYVHSIPSIHVRSQSKYLSASDGRSQADPGRLLMALAPPIPEYPFRSQGRGNGVKRAWKKEGFSPGCSLH